MAGFARGIVHVEPATSAEEPVESATWSRIKQIYR